MHRSKFDPNQIVQCEHNEELMAKRVEIVSAEMSMELDADDGDSVQTQGRVFEYVDMQNDTPAQCTACREVKVYIKTNTEGATNVVDLHVSGSDSGDNFEQIGTAQASSTAGEVVSIPKHSILAKRMKVTGVDANVEITILGRG